MRGRRLRFKIQTVYYNCTSVSGDLVSAHSADPEEMPQYVAFHLGLHCVLK